MRIHFCNTGPSFPYAYYLAVMTALRTQSAPVVLWLVEEPTGRYFNLLRQEQALEIVCWDEDIPDFPALEGKSAHEQRVAIFDYVMWRIVADEGGVVMGLDSITLGDLGGLLPDGKEMVVARDDDRVPNSFSPHGAAVRPGSELARKICQASRAALEGLPRDFVWGSAGIIPFLAVVRANLEQVEVAPYGLIGGINHDGQEPFLYRDDGELLHPDARTYPLYATAHKQQHRLITERWVRNSSALYARLVRDILSEKEWYPTRRPHAGTHSHPEMRFHLLGLAHIPTARALSTCAYTQKVVKLAKMLRSLGHVVYFYGVEGSDVECDESVPVLSEEKRRAVYGDYDWWSEFFKHSGSDDAQGTFNENAVREIQARVEPGDFLLCTMGNYQQPIAAAVDGVHVVESGIGYRGIFAPYRVFESYAWLHYLYGLTNAQDGRWYDAVIPNYFNPDDFPFEPQKQNYALYIGRLVKRKGLDVAVQVTRELGMGLIMAGQGTLKNQVEGLDITDGHVSFVGAVGPRERAMLMGRARVVLAPTYYIEPFGGVAVEAQLCGTPVVTTDWGAFSETVQHGVTGYRCRTFEQFLWAVDNVDQIDPQDCRRWAMENYSLERVRWMYQEFFEQIGDLRRAGWYEQRPRRVELDWLRRVH